MPKRKRRRFRASRIFSSTCFARSFQRFAPQKAAWQIFFILFLQSISICIKVHLYMWIEIISSQGVFWPIERVFSSWSIFKTDLHFAYPDEYVFNLVTSKVVKSAAFWQTACFYYYRSFSTTSYVVFMLRSFLLDYWRIEWMLKLKDLLKHWRILCNFEVNFKFVHKN